MKKVLIIEDDPDLQEGLSFSLTAEGYETVTAADIKEGRKHLSEKNIDGIILDCNLPDGNGFEFCQEIRKTSSIPILILTARDTELDEVKALELGANDYMSKPFSVSVLKVRLKKLLWEEKTLSSLHSNGLHLDRLQYRVYKGTEEIVLSKVEYRLLLFFMEHKNQVLSKEQILEHIWDCEARFVDDNTVSVNMRRLRQKVEMNPSQPQYIKTVHGLGYIWKEG